MADETPAEKTPAEVLAGVYVPKIVVSGTGTVTWSEKPPTKES